MSAAQQVVTIDTSGMTLDDVVAVARGNASVKISVESLTAMAATREQIDALANSPLPVYGVSTVFVILSILHIPVEDRVKLLPSLNP